MNPENNDVDATAESWNRTASDNKNESPIADSTYLQNTSTIDSNISKGSTEPKPGHHSGENIISKTKRIVQEHWEQTRRSLIQARRKVSQMVPQSASNLVYWRNPIVSGITFGVLLSFIITFMFLSSLAACSFWLLAFLIVIGLYKLYNYVMATFVGSVRDDIFDSMLPANISISEQQARDLANNIRMNGTSLLKHGRDVFLWQNITNSALHGLVLFVFFYIGLSINALTLALVSLIFLFTVPKIYQVYQVPIDRTAKQVLDQINQLLAKVTSKLPNKAKKP